MKRRTSAGSKREQTDKAPPRAARGSAHQKVPDAAKGTRAYVDKDPKQAERAAKRAKRSPRAASGTRVSVDELVAKGRTLVDRVRPFFERLAARLRSRFRRAHP